MTLRSGGAAPPHGPLALCAPWSRAALPAASGSVQQPPRGGDGGDPDPLRPRSHDQLVGELRARSACRAASSSVPRRSAEDAAKAARSCAPAASQSPTQVASASWPLASCRRLGASSRSLSQLSAGGGGGRRDALGARRASTSGLFPRIPCAGAPEPVAASWRSSTPDLGTAAGPTSPPLRWSLPRDSRAAAAAQTLRSLSDACRSRSFGVLPAGGPLPELQAARLQCQGSADLQQGAKQRSSWPKELMSLREPGAECRDWATHAIAGFIGPPRSRASRGSACPVPPAEPQPKPKRQEARFGFGLDRECSAVREAPSTCAPSPNASESEGSQVSEDAELQVPLAATLLEVYAGYADEEVEVHDRFIALAFRRFSVHGANEVTRELLHDALIHMGFLTSTRQRSLCLATQLSNFQNFDYMDFLGYVNRFAALERSAVRQRAGACLAERPERADGAAARDLLQQFLRSAGVCFPYSHVEKMQKAALLDHVRPQDMSTNDLLLTLAACRVDEGFTKEQVAAAAGVFGGLEQDPRMSSSRWSATAKAAKASKLMEGLLKFTGLYSVDYIDMLAHILPSDSAEQHGICFYEFLIWARRLRDLMMQDLWKCFEDFDTSGSGRIQLDTAILISERFGISLLSDAVDELLSSLGLQREAALDFDALVQFVGAARSAHGFTRSEQEVFSAAFQKFNHHGTGELTHLQVLELLRHLGHTMRADEVSPLIKRVDFNKNGSMDLHEFLRLMRLMREESIRCARKSFDELSSSTGRMPKGSVKDALAKQQLFPQDDVLAELMRDMPAEASFTSFMHVYDRCRFRLNLEFRKRGGFAEDTVAEIASLWNGGCGEISREFATVNELIWMFTGSQEVPVNTRQGREELLRRLQAAREAAIEAGVPEEEASVRAVAAQQGEASHGRVSSIGFYTFVHLIRGFVRDSEQEVIDREKGAVSFASFPNSEAAEFRRVFSDLAEREAGKSLTCEQLAGSKGHRVDKLLTRLTVVPAIPVSAMALFLKSIGLHVSSSKMQDLKPILAQTSSRGEADEGTIQFATFLRLLRWMIDTDFAGICSAMELRKG